MITSKAALDIAPCCSLAAWKQGPHRQRSADRPRSILEVELFIVRPVSGVVLRIADAYWNLRCSEFIENGRRTMARPAVGFGLAPAVVTSSTFFCRQLRRDRSATDRCRRTSDYRRQSFPCAYRRHRALPRQLPHPGAARGLVLRTQRPGSATPGARLCFRLLSGMGLGRSRVVIGLAVGTMVEDAQSSGRING